MRPHVKCISSARQCSVEARPPSPPAVLNLASSSDGTPRFFQSLIFFRNDKIELYAPAREAATFATTASFARLGRLIDYKWCRQLTCRGYIQGLLSVIQWDLQKQYLQH